MSEFAYAVCNVGSEALLVEEVARRAPGIVPAYRRKGLLTFKVAPQLEFPPAVFARVQGMSLGLVDDPAAIPTDERAVLHVFARDAGPDGPDPSWLGRARAVEDALRHGFAAHAVPAPGDRVVDVIVGAEEALLVGTRVQGEGWKVPGGRPSISVPADAPSRAFLKLEEALAWSGLEVTARDAAVELGAAPGGAAYALLRRGVPVIAVDPANLDPRVCAYEGPGGARVRHLQREAGALRRGDIDPQTTLLLCDMNIAPPVALRAVTSVAAWLRPSLRAAILTLKLNDQKMVDAIPDLLARVEALGLPACATQLPSNRREICVVAVSRE